MSIFETCLIWVDAQLGKDGGYFTHKQENSTPCMSPSDLLCTSKLKSNNALLQIKSDIEQYLHLSILEICKNPWAIGGI